MKNDNSIVIKNEWLFMDGKRRVERFRDNNEIIVNILSGENKEKFFYNHNKDISVLGARIQTNMFLPVGTLIKLEIPLKTMYTMTTTIGKVKWSKATFHDDSSEAGVEFFTPPRDVIKKLADYISLKQKHSMLNQG